VAHRAAAPDDTALLIGTGCFGLRAAFSRRLISHWRTDRSPRCSCVAQLAEYFNKWALVYAALTGSKYTHAGSEVSHHWQLFRCGRFHRLACTAPPSSPALVALSVLQVIALFRKRGWTAVINDDLTGSAMSIACLMVGAISAAFGGGIAFVLMGDASDGTVAGIAAFLSFLVGIAMVRCRQMPAACSINDLQLQFMHRLRCLPARPPACLCVCRPP